MDEDLTFEEGRVLGCLIEKEMATPEYYPMTLNSLMAACNQKSSREPQVAFDTPTIEKAIAGLRDKGLATLVHQSGARGAKNKHRVTERFPDLKEPHVALLALLLLRGRQTVGELRTRSERLHKFGNLGEVERTLDFLIGNAPEPLVKMLPPGGGRHTKSFVQLLCGAPAGVEVDSVAVAEREESGGPTLREEVRALRGELEALRAEFDSFKAQF